MPADLFTDLLLASLVISLSPIPIIAITLVLSTARARANGLAFSGGWLAGLLIITTVLTWLADGVEAQGDSGSSALYLIKLAAGMGLLLVAARKWSKRPAKGEEPALPGWMASIDQIKPGRALVLGFTLAAVNPKNLAFALVAANAIALSGRAGSAEWMGILVFVLLASWSVLGSTGFYLITTDKAASGLARVKDFMARNNALIMAVLFAFFGVKLVINGLTGLLGG
ncbi:MAG: GAP family protein [Anaerolineae bacterium]|nr:GAP family protein [Anaerolineae bacterium]